MELLLIIGLGFAVACGLIAKGKGREPILWGLIGFMTGVIGLIVIACLSEVKND